MERIYNIRFRAFNGCYKNIEDKEERMLEEMEESNSKKDEEKKLDSEITEILESCKKRWAIPDVHPLFCHYPQWIQEMPEELAIIVNSLMTGFDYYSHHSVNRNMKELHQQLQQQIQFDNTIYCVLPNQEGRINSGYEYLIEYKNLNGLSKYVVFPNLSVIQEKTLSYIKTIVFIDDFCGTGKTFIDYLEKAMKYVQGREVFYVVIHIMEKALGLIEKYGKEHNLSIHVLYKYSTPKAFERKLQPLEKRSSFKRLSLEYGLSKKHVLGYNNTEALVAFYNNTPNNTLEVFWQNVENHPALFPRVEDKKPEWMRMQKQAKSRRTSNYLKGCIK